MKYILNSSGRMVDGKPTYKTHHKNIFLVWDTRRERVLKIFNVEDRMRDIGLISGLRLNDHNEMTECIDNFARHVKLINKKPPLPEPPPPIKRSDPTVLGMEFFLVVAIVILLSLLLS